MYKISFYKSEITLTDDEISVLSIGETHHKLTASEYANWLNISRNKEVKTMTVITEESPESVKEIFGNSGYRLLAQGSEFEYE